MRPTLLQAAARGMLTVHLPAMGVQARLFHMLCRAESASTLRIGINMNSAHENSGVNNGRAATSKSRPDNTTSLWCITWYYLKCCIQQRKFCSQQNLHHDHMRSKCQPGTACSRPASGRISVEGGRCPNNAAQWLRLVQTKSRLVSSASNRPAGLWQWVDVPQQCRHGQYFP